MSNIKDFITKYNSYISNIQWHIETNNPHEEEIKKFNTQIDSYKEVLADLKHLSLQQNKVSDVSAEENEIEFLKNKVRNAADEYLEVSKALNILQKHSPDFDDESGLYYRGDSVLKIMVEYASIVNERKDNVDVSDAYQIVKKMADWSNKYPRDRVYHMEKISMDNELIEIEELAKKFIESQSKQKEVELWVNVYKNKYGGYDSWAYDSESVAIKTAKNDSDFKGTYKLPIKE